MARAHTGGDVFLGLGGNVGDRRGFLERAIAWIEAHPRIGLLDRTGLVETAPWGRADQPAFLNGVVRVVTDLAPRALLVELKRAEEALGRTSAGAVRWGPREIDLDILLYGDEVVDEPDLVIPHPRLVDRRFVLEQLLELAPDITHPVHGAMLRSFLSAL